MDEAFRLLNRDQPAELEPHQLDRSLGSQRTEAVVAEEVSREDRAVAQKAVGERRVGGMAETERLDCRQAPIVALADAGEEEALQGPRAVWVREVRAGDQHGIG